jgi:Fur family ferric uptake transcriptional regulator
MLAILEKLGLVRKLDFGDGQSRYEFIQGDEHHHHLICIKCGKAIDISGKTVESCADEVYSLANSLSKEFDFDVQTHRLEFWGICPECREKRDHCK